MPADSLNPVSTKKPGAAFWATVVVLLALIGYPLSFGPACWINQRWDGEARVISAIYRPVLVLASEDGQLPQPIFWYARIGARDDDVPVVRRGQLVWREQMIRGLERRYASLVVFNRGPFHESTPEKSAPEKIRWVDPAGSRVWIGLGNADVVEPGTAFRVRKAPPSAAAADNPQSDDAYGEIIGRIAITRVIEMYLSEARILEQDHDRPIVKGDSVVR